MQHLVGNYYLNFNMEEKDVVSAIQKYRPFLKPVVRLSKSQKFVVLDLSTTNKSLTPETMANVDSLSNYIDQQLLNANAAFGIGGYLENRKLYQHSPLFDAQQTFEEPRTIHLGVDIWGSVGTPIYMPLGGTVHSFAFNNHQGDYGATIILQHQLEGVTFHTLYGHLALADLKNIRENNFLSPGLCIGHFGAPSENGNWPPHLHFQIIVDMQIKKGDYPGVCSFSQITKHQQNCPNPMLMLQQLIL